MELLILCIKIFLVRILDVSLGTIRTIITVKGKTWLAATVGFLELFIWFVIVKEALNTDNNSIFIAISYAGGFATGTYIGGIISNKIIHTDLTIQIITNEADKLAEILRNNNYAVSILDIEGKDKETDRKMLLLQVSDRNLNNIKKIVREIDNKAFVFINETKYVFNGYYGVKKED